MSKKLLSVLLALMLVLGCTVMAGAETVTVNEYADDPVLSQMDAQRLDEAKDAVIATLPEEMQNSEFFLTADEDSNVSVVAVNHADAPTVQEMIDQGKITEQDTEVPEDVCVEVMTVDFITPLTEDEDGNMVNAISTYASVSSVTIIPSWSTVNDGGYTLSVRLSYVRYTSGSSIAFRPLDLGGKYSGSTVSQMCLAYGYSGSVYTYPGYFDSPSTSLVESGALNNAQAIISNPSSNYAYSRATGFSSSNCIEYTSARPIELGIVLKNSSGVIVAYAYPNYYI